MCRCHLALCLQVIKAADFPQDSPVLELDEIRRYSVDFDHISVVLRGGWSHLQDAHDESHKAFAIRLYQAILNLCRLYKDNDNSLPEDQPEAWYANNEWKISIKLVDGGSECLSFQTGEVDSGASSLRKNGGRDLGTRQACGWKIDGIIKCKKTMFEIGAIKIGRKDEGPSGTKVLKDGRKVSKLFKDMSDHIGRMCVRTSEMRSVLVLHETLHHVQLRPS
ncbi:hypothetical protein EDD21DRAFT_371663 [Dissophora ornata]|nr:hypothetical protein EDD21DRAFT_371663 [Dissophora ornata]